LIYRIDWPNASHPESGEGRMDRLLPILMIAAGAILVIASIVIVNIPDYDSSFPILLIGGGVLVFWGIKKYREG
jgi:hypothetical protein